MMRHSPESFREMWNELTNGEWQVESAHLQSVNDMPDLALVFAVRKQEKKGFISMIVFIVFLKFSLFIRIKSGDTVNKADVRVSKETKI